MSEPRIPTVDLATSEELLDELVKRYDHLVFGAAKDHPQVTDHWQVVTRWKGNGLCMQGLATSLIRKVQDSEDYDKEGMEDL